MAPVYKLKSFDYVGVAESIRYLFAYGGIPYENIVVKNDIAWADMQKTVPFGKLPILYVDNEVLFEPVPISWYIAKLVDLAPNDTLEEAELGAFAITACKFAEKVFDWYLEQDKYKKEIMQAELEGHVFPKYLTDFERIVQKKGVYFGGKKISWADIFFAGVFVTVQGVWNKDLLQKQYPLLYQIYKDVHNIPAIKAYVTKYVPNYKY